MLPNAHALSGGAALQASGGRLASQRHCLGGGAPLWAPQARPALRCGARERTSRLAVEARTRQRRLLSYVLSAPQRVDRYLRSAWWRRWTWAGSSLATGYYAANILTLSFGALAVNDVLAAVVTLFFCEVVTHLYYTDNSNSLVLWYLNCFKMGLIASMLADAAKLGS
ncbi:putative family Ycf20 [Micractinium conductrix]|uniref:Family Ycf20 n=1 Tax=Micractinium conductrix TaxID=554055 RepID=A0A2P6VFK6_9CHLO|nr:putative family Ycf20 [Micractinium conductrix]|eukprot:PSC72873.1 putative family Ycf20 [Micractinium conductrix]